MTMICCLCSSATSTSRRNLRATASSASLGQLAYLCGFGVRTQVSWLDGESKSGLGIGHCQAVASHATWSCDAIQENCVFVADRHTCELASQAGVTTSRPWQTSEEISNWRYACQLILSATASYLLTSKRQRTCLCALMCLRVSTTKHATLSETL